MERSRRSSEIMVYEGSGIRICEQVWARGISEFLLRKLGEISCSLIRGEICGGLYPTIIMRRITLSLFMRINDNVLMVIATLEHMIKLPLEYLIRRTTLSTQSHPIFKILSNQINLNSSMAALALTSKVNGVRRIKMKFPQAAAEAQMRQHAITMVGRVLNVQAQEGKVKNLIGFMPTVWECAGRV
ncbi:unnamed protein product [Cochlearia groenlandica]